MTSPAPAVREPKRLLDAVTTMEAQGGVPIPSGSWPLVAGIWLRRREQDVGYVAKALNRVKEMLERERWHVRLASQAAGATLPDVLDADHAHAPLSNLDLRSEATAGELRAWREGNRMRLWYRPRLWAFFVTTVLTAIVIGLATAFWVRYGSFGIAALRRFDFYWHGVAKYLLAAALAYPIMRWRMKRMLKAAIRYSDAKWDRYQDRWHAWRRLVVSLVLSWGAVLELYPGLWDDFRFNAGMLWIAQPGWVHLRPTVIQLAWLGGTMLVLTVLVFGVDWEYAFSRHGSFAVLWNAWRRIGSGDSRRARVARWLRPSWPMAAGALVMALGAHNWIGDGAERAADFVRTIVLESRGIMKATDRPLAVTLPGSSDVVLRPGSTAHLVRSIGQPQVTIGITGVAHIDVGLDRDSLHLVGGFEATLLKGSYTVANSLAGDALQVSVERGAAYLYDAARPRFPGIWVYTGETRKLLNY